MKTILSKGGTALKKYNEFLYDDIGNEYTRKNQYILELAKNQASLSSMSASEKEKVIKAINVLTHNRRNHPYNLALGDYKQEERNFLITLNAKAKQYKSELDSSQDSKLKKLEKNLFVAEEKVKFYSKYTALTYDADLEYEKNRIISEQLPEIIQKYLTTKEELKSAKEKLGKIDPAKEAAHKIALKSYVEHQNVLAKENKQKLRDKRKSKLISEKALRNGIIEIRKKRKESINLKSYESETKATKELIGNKKYVLRKGIKRDLTVLKSNIADSRRKIPVEVYKTKPLNAWFTFYLPGLGQLLNKQYLKAALFAIISLFIYLVAIPYALGFGNYQGEGISGLVSLAAEGKRSDRSLIFMIEGIVAIFLSLFAFAGYLLSFFDVRNVERDMIKGIRPRNSFETLSKVENEGFPYMVSLPAL